MEVFRILVRAFYASVIRVADVQIPLVFTVRLKTSGFIWQRLFLAMFLMACSAVGFAQEVCDNGIDDDGDGLVDIYDPDCECIGVNTYMDLTSYIPNPDLETMLCCPMSVSDMPCCEAWIQGTAASTDYLHTCGFVMPAVAAAGLVPFPSGEACVGGYFYEGWREYPGVCLNNPLEVGVEYTFSFQIAATNIGGNCDPINFSYDPVEVTLFGHPSCLFPVNTSDCPIAGDPIWEALGFVEYTPVASWMQVDITFTPTMEMNGIMVGAPCVFPPGYEGGPCFAYIVYDDFSLFGGVELAELFLSEIGLPCESDYTLLADVNHNGGIWQWYFNGAAIPGQNDPEFMIANNNFLSGTYAVTYSTPDGCVIDSIQVIVPTLDPNVENISYCPGTDVDCAGQTFSSPGIYEVTLTGPDGCDSVVTCVVEEYVLPPVTNMQIDTCAPVVIQVCNEFFSESGLFEIHCFDWRGCDSVVMLDLRVMEPVAIIQPPGLLDCDPSAVVVLDGLGSSINPVFNGSTQYLWEGPQDGFVGPIDEANTLVNKPGKYCLTVIHESNGVICLDSTCVTVVSSSELPSEPVILGVTDLCMGDTLLLQPIAGGGAPATGFEWSYDPGLNVIFLNIDHLRFVPDGPGVTEFCLSAYNECGSSDSICVHIQTSTGDTTFTQIQTCDPALAGIDTVLLQTQFGCDSMSIVERILVPAIEVILPSTTCDPLVAGIDTVIYQTSGGCDSLVISQRTLLPSSQGNFQGSTCDPALVGVDTTWHQNQFGCDSLAITTTDLLPSHVMDQIVYTCDPTQVGMDTFMLTNQYGCDSIIYLERVYSGIFQVTNQTSICGAGTNYTDTLLITSGPCDSLFITQYIHVALDTTWLTSSSCDPGQAGVFVSVLPAVTGCDSTLIQTVSLLPTDSILVSSLTCDPNEVHFEVLNLQNQYGCDSTVTIDIQYAGVDTVFILNSSCDPTQVGITVAVIPGVVCDTIQVTETTFSAFSESHDTIKICGPVSLLFDTLFLVNAFGCDSLAIRTFQYTQLASSAAIKGETCTGDEDGQIDVTNILGGVAPYEVQLNSGSWQTNTSFIDLTPGQYTVYIRDINGCADTLIGLVVNPGFSVALDAGPDRTATLGEVIDLSLQATQSISQVQWNATDPLDCPNCLQTSLGPLTGSQTVVVTGWTEDGCSDSDEIVVTVETRVKVFIPNSFTPNNDGINDVFSIYGNDQIHRIRNLAIFDRWGNALYARADLSINDPSAGWDGTFRDDVMDPGVYIYVVEVELIDGSVRLYKGDVTVVR